MNSIAYIVLLLAFYISMPIQKKNSIEVSNTLVKTHSKQINFVFVLSNFFDTIVSFIWQKYSCSVIQNFEP